MQQPDPQHVQQMMTILMPMMMIFGVIGSVLVVVPFWVIFKKAGLGAPLSLLMLVPVVGLIMLYVLAFSKWKVVPAPEYAMGYPPAYPPPGYAPAAYPPAQPGYAPPPPPVDPNSQI